jgi:hypothetical protein
MDWGLIFGAGAFFVALIVAISTFVYFIMRLMILPIKDDMDEMKVSVKEISNGLKSETDLVRLIDERVVKHERSSYHNEK